jgi:LuxR family maltose regulon positive regulatory protein
VQDVSALLDGAEGWVAALVAGAQRLRVRADRGWIRQQGPADLLQAWFEALPPRRRDLLESTAALRLLGSGPVAAVAGPDAAAALEELQRCHDYVTAVPPPGGHPGKWWRRHPVLSAFLAMRGAVTDQHSRAADWFAAQGDVTEAMHHLIAAGDVRKAADYLSEHESALISTGQGRYVAQWYDRLARRADAELNALLRTGWGLLLARDIRGADAAVERLRALLADNPPDPDPEIADWVAEEALLRCYLAVFHGDPQAMIDNGRVACAGSGERNRDGVQLAPILLARGLLWSGDADQAVQVLAGVRDQPHPNATIREMTLASTQAMIECARGEVGRAAATVAGIERWSAASGIDPVSMHQYSPLLARTEVDLELGDLDRAQQGAAAAVAGAEATGNHSEAALAWLLTARLHLRHGDPGSALRCVEQARSHAQARNHKSALLVPVDQVQALVYIAAGDMMRAERIVSRLPPSPTRSVLSARAALRSAPVMARHTLEALPPCAPRVEIDKHLVLAALHSADSRALAQGHLRKAAALARACSLRHPVLPPTAALADLIAASADEDVVWLRGGADGPAPQRRPALSKGELQLLVLLPTRAKNVDIAAMLGVSINTVKTRLRRLYIKLDVANRDDAIEKARARGLLPPP